MFFIFPFCALKWKLGAVCACTLGVRGDPLPRDRGEFCSLDVRNANGVAVDMRPVFPRVGPYMFARCVCAKRVSLVKLAPLRKTHAQDPMEVSMLEYMNRSHA